MTRRSWTEPERARAIAQVAGVAVDTARVEVDYIRMIGNQGDTTSTFFNQVQPALTGRAKGRSPACWGGVTRHRMKG